MIASLVTALVANGVLGLSAEQLNPVGRYPFGPAIRGSVLLTVAQAPTRGLPHPSRPRGETFVPGFIDSSFRAAALVSPAHRSRKTAVIPDLFEVVFYTKTRPVRLSVAISTDGMSLDERWNAHLTKLFTNFDRDRNGFLNRYELEHIFPVSGVRGMLQGEYYTRANGPPPQMQEIDRNGDGRVSPTEFVEHFGDVLSDLVKPRAIQGAVGGQDPATTELFARLDGDRNGRLSREELHAAERILLALDSDEDECVSNQELLSNPLNRTQISRPLPMRTGARTTGSSPEGRVPPDVVVFKSDLPESVVKEVLKRYGTSIGLGLSRAQIGFDPPTFARLDANADSELSSTELEAWRTGEADGVITLTFAESAAACKAVARPAHADGWPEGLTVRQTEPGRLILRIGSQTLEFNASSPPRGNRRNQFQMMFGGVFSAETKFVEDKDLVGPQNQFLRVVFEAADFNTDGRLTRDEFSRYFDLQQSTTELGLALAYVTRTPNLFQTFDDNVDGKLAVRELRTAWDRLIVMEPSGAEAVTKDILQPSVTFRLTPSAFATYDPATFGASRPASQVSGPLWFRKMDRNSDGDVSRAEFLGSINDFRILDANSDALISLDEAETFDKRVRPPKPESKKKGRGKTKLPWFIP